MQRYQGHSFNYNERANSVTPSQPYRKSHVPPRTANDYS